MSEKSKDAEEKPDNPFPEKPAATELSDKALEQVSGGIGQSLPSGDTVKNIHTGKTERLTVT
jgi:bacteriocin-like protein